MRFPIAALAFSTLTLAATPALAGPPFICHAFDLSGNPSLPWSSTAAGWNNPDPAYDVSKLTADVTNIVPVADGPPPHRYTYEDREVEAGRSYYYYLESISKGGLKSRLSGVVTRVGVSPSGL